MGQFLYFSIYGFLVSLEIEYGFMKLANNCIPFYYVFFFFQNWGKIFITVYFLSEGSYT